MKALFLAITQLTVRAQHDLEMTCQVFFAEQFGHTRYTFTFVAGNLQQGGIGASYFGYYGVAKKSDHLTREMSRTVTFTNQLIHHTQHIFAGSLSHRLHDLFQHSRGRSSDELPHFVQTQPSA